MNSFNDRSEIRCRKNGVKPKVLSGTGECILNIIMEKLFVQHALTVVRHSSPQRNIRSLRGKLLHKSTITFEYFTLGIKQKYNIPKATQTHAKVIVA